MHAMRRREREKKAKALARLYRCHHDRYPPSFPPKKKKRMKFDDEEMVRMTTHNQSSLCVCPGKTKNKAHPTPGC
jgi:hypothetical protein